MILFKDHIVNNTLAPNITDVVAKYNLWKSSFAQEDSSMSAFYLFITTPSVERTLFLNNFSQSIQVMSPTITSVIYQ